MKKLTMTMVAMMCAIATFADYNVRDFGAAGDGKTLDSPCINATIEAAVKDGGGKIIVPSGKYLSGAIRMKSNIELHLEPGAVIIAAPASICKTSFCKKTTCK